MANRTVFSVKITEANPGGVTGFVKGVRAFIPASKIGLDYVEDTESYVGMTLNAIIITADANEKDLSSQQKKSQEKTLCLNIRRKFQNSQLAKPFPERLCAWNHMESLLKQVKTLQDFVIYHRLQINLSNLKEVVKPGDTVSAKIIALDGDRISLSMKALEDDVPDAKEDTYEIPDEFRADKEDDTDESPFAKLLKGIKL